MNVEIFDILGKTIATQKISVRAESNVHSIPMDRLNTGTYVVKVSGSEVSDMLTVMKVN